jgi:hyperosmotically inducible protein
MRIAQLTQLTVAFGLVAAVGCNRAETRDQTQRAAEDVKNAATRAGQRIGNELADGWMTTRIQSQYFADQQVKARYIDVSSDNGTVTLRGFVETPAAHERALQIARNTSGVRQVNDQILIGQSPKAFEASQRPVPTTGTTPAPAAGEAPLDDERVQNTIQAAFFLDPAVKGRRIDVEAHTGVVTLKGEVASEAERAQALALARNAEGVQRVEDNLTVNAALDGPDSSSPSAAPVADDASLTARVKSQLGADAQLKEISVVVKDGVLELRGTVPSAAAHQRALAAASGTTGITQVVDRLTVKRR